MTDPEFRDELIRLCGDDPAWSGVLEQYDAGQGWPGANSSPVAVVRLHRAIDEAADALVDVEGCTDEANLRAGINRAISVLARSLADPIEKEASE